MSAAADPTGAYALALARRIVCMWDKVAALRERVTPDPIRTALTIATTEGEITGLTFALEVLVGEPMHRDAIAEIAAGDAPPRTTITEGTPS